jgi:hypothetical protein
MLGCPAVIVGGVQLRKPPTVSDHSDQVAPNVDTPHDRFRNALNATDRIYDLYNAIGLFSTSNTHPRSSGQ